MGSAYTPCRLPPCATRHTVCVGMCACVHVIIILFSSWLRNSYVAPFCIWKKHCSILAVFGVTFISTQASSRMHIFAWNRNTHPHMADVMLKTCLWIKLCKIMVMKELLYWKRCRMCASVADVIARSHTQTNSKYSCELKTLPKIWIDVSFCRFYTVVCKCTWEKF